MSLSICCTNCFVEDKILLFPLYSRSRDYPKKCARCIRNCSPRNTALIEQIFSLTAVFPTLPRQTVLARAQSPTLAVKVREAVSSLQLTDPGCPSCKGCTGNQKTEQPSLTGTVRSPISWHCDHLTTCNTSLCGERKILTVRGGVSTRLQWRRQKRKSCGFQSQAVSSSIFCTSICSSSSIHKKMTRQLKGFVHRSLSTMATRGSTQCPGLSAYSAHTGSGICYNLWKKHLFGAQGDAWVPTSQRCRRCDPCPSFSLSF